MKTFRKLNAFVWMTVQSPETITDNEVGRSIISNTPNFLLMPADVSESQRTLYMREFQLKSYQVDMIAQLQPKRDYLLVSAGQAHIMQAHFTKEVLAYVRSESSVLKLFNAFKQSGHPQWREKYIARVTEL